MNNSVKNTQFLFDKFIGILIFLNIFHQVISSMDLRGYESMLSSGNIFFQLSMLIFLGEVIYRFILERKLGFLNVVDSLVLINYFFIGILDLRIFRLFRFFDITKIGPIKKFEDLPNGIGIMADDIVAGLFAFITQAAILTGLNQHIFINKLWNLHQKIK